MSGPTLGDTLKGARLGYGWSDAIGAYVRLEDASGGFVVDIRPSGQIPRDLVGTLHRVWWSDEEAARRVGDALRPIVAGGLRSVEVRRSLRFVIDDDGRPVASLQR